MERAGADDGLNTQLPFQQGRRVDAEIQNLCVSSSRSFAFEVEVGSDFPVDCTRQRSEARDGVKVCALGEGLRTVVAVPQIFVPDS